MVDSAHEPSSQAPAPNRSPIKVRLPQPQRTPGVTPTPRLDDTHVEELLGALGPSDEPPPDAEREDDAIELELLEHPTAPGPGGERVPAFFQAAAPRPLPSEGEALDLAALAERAIDGAPEPRRTSWRDERYGPYQLLERVAVGGMAEVFKAKRTGVEGFEKIVAVKRILPHLSENQEFVGMFVDEAKMVAGLSHPNIVQIFDLGRIEKTYYIAMEYVNGRDLRTIMRRGRERGLRLPIDLALRIGRAVAAALDYAHRRRDDRGRAIGIVHRDVSPQNILISFEGDVKLADFGIAKAATKAADSDRGSLRGKINYMSPEQAWGRPIDQRSDLFSLGIVLYEMITDERVFAQTSTEMGTLELVRQCKFRPPREVSPRVPEDVEKVILKALAREADERYQTAGEMDRALEWLLRGRNAPIGHELAHFLEILFDAQERDEPPPEIHRPDPAAADAALKRIWID
jgi:serine/threonine protein kinase